MGKKPGDPAGWPCPHCDREFVTSGALDRHVASEHGSTE